jgi:purine-nucleoside phosphorylase
MDNAKFFEFCYGCSPSSFSESVIVTPFLPLKHFEKCGDVVSQFAGKLYSGATISKNAKKVTVVRCGMGSQFMGDAVLLLKGTPVKEVIFTGSCGGLKDCRIGDLIICESAFNGEGFSGYYAKDFTIKEVFDSGTLIPADSVYTEGLREFVASRLKDKGFLKVGDIFTIGSIMAETRENLLSIEEKGFRGIDIELSAVYQAAQAAGLKAAGLLFVSDLPLKKPLGEELSVSEKKDHSDGIERLIRFIMEFVFK